MIHYDFDEFFVAFGILAFFLGMIALVALVIYLVGLWKMYQKAGKKGWEAIIPFYNNWILVEIAGLSWWYFFLVIANFLGSFFEFESFGTILSLVGLFFCNYNISKKLHKDVGFAILMTLFPVIMIPLIGFSNQYQFDPNVAVSENGPINSRDASVKAEYDNHEKSNGKANFCPNCGNRLDSDSKYCGNCGKKIS